MIAVELDHPKRGNDDNHGSAPAAVAMSGLLIFFSDMVHLRCQPNHRSGTVSTVARSKSEALNSKKI